MIYTKKLEEFVDSFCTKHQLFNPSTKLLLSISGGVDSIVLFHVFMKLNKVFEVIHFNHGTRSANVIEEKLIRELCHKNSVKLHVVHLNMKLNLANFEALARKKRQAKYKIFIKNNYTVVCAHHLDDAFEWHLMQKFKQSSLKKLLGMPVKNHGVVRPFFCLSKKHIYRYAKINKLIWMEDESNQSIRFERNYLRLKISNEIIKQYPHYLKQFVSQQQNLLALYLKDQSALKIVPHQLGGVVVSASDLTLHHDRILEVIESLSKVSRGRLSNTLNQLFNSFEKSRSDPKKRLFFGPFKFSGGVFAILYADCIYFYTKHEIDLWGQVDISYCHNRTGTQITYGLLNQTGLKYFPNLHLGVGRKSKLVFPLLSEFISKEKKSDILYSYLV